VVLILALSLYFALNACLGLWFHLTVRYQMFLKPRFGELLVYVPVTCLFGLPIVSVVMISGLAAGLMQKEPLT